MKELINTHTHTQLDFWANRGKKRALQNDEGARIIDKLMASLHKTGFVGKRKAEKPFSNGRVFSIWKGEFGHWSC